MVHELVVGTGRTSGHENDVFGPVGVGVLVLERIMTRIDFAEISVSKHDILHGVAWSLVPWWLAVPCLTAMRWRQPCRQVRVAG